MYVCMYVCMYVYTCIYTYSTCYVFGYLDPQILGAHISFSLFQQRDAQGLSEAEFGDASGSCCDGDSPIAGWFIGEYPI